MRNLPSREWVHGFLGPVEVGGGDELLQAVGQGSEEGVTPLDVELAEDVVDEEDRSEAAVGIEELGLSELEGERETALLAFGAEVAGAFSVEGEEEIVAVWPDGGEAAPCVVFAGLVECGSEGSRLSARLPFDGRHLGAPAQSGVSLLHEGTRRIGDGRSKAHELLAGLDEDCRVGVDLRPGKRVALEQEVSTLEGLLVGAELLSVFGVELTPHKVEKLPPPEGVAADKLNVAIAHPHDPTALLQIFTDRINGRVVDGKFPLTSAIADTEASIRGHAALDKKVILLKLDQFFLLPRARALQPEQEADRLKECRLPFAVGPQENRTIFRQLELYFGEAAQVA